MVHQVAVATEGDDVKLTAEQQLAIDVAAAEQYGRMAHEAGHARVPAFDADYNALRRAYSAGISFGSPGFSDACKATNKLGMAWLRGWDQSCAKAA